MLNVIKVKLLSERTSGVPPVIFDFDICVQMAGAVSANLVLGTAKINL